MKMVWLVSIWNCKPILEILSEMSEINVNCFTIRNYIQSVNERRALR